MKDAHKKGMLAENLVCEYILKNNYKVLAKNFRGKHYEIDIIALKEDILVFIEVKARQNTEMDAALLNSKKIKHIKEGIEQFILITDETYRFIRFDFAFVDALSEIFYIENALEFN